MSKLQQTEDHTQDILRQQEVMHEQRWLSLRQTQRDITRRISNIDGVLVELGLAVAPPEDQKGGSWT
ncbi:hypothetical protein MKY96_33770 [Paenibacillus sp. FSL R7-0302]|uniref:hypothetical protein n=1 Tax=Paenibacillus sp. FSL R7-0302 TaxID=2921681 RepID=UPI0030FBE9E4